MQILNTLPERAKDFFILISQILPTIESLLPLLGEFANGLVPRALPWATMDWAFSPPFCYDTFREHYLVRLLQKSTLKWSRLFRHFRTPNLKGRWYTSIPEFGCTHLTEHQKRGYKSTHRAASYNLFYSATGTMSLTATWR